MALEFVERIARIPYYPVASAYAHDGPLTLLASNETPYPPLAAVAEAITSTLGGLNRYPDPYNLRLRQSLADRHDLRPERVAIGNGSCDILLAAAQALLEPGAEFVHPWPSFSVYPQLEAISGARAIRVALDADHCLDLDAMQAEITVATRIVIVCNPNNPTSTALPPERVAAFVRGVPPHVCVILDEAYCEFNLLGDPDDSLALLADHPNLVLLRTFSKIYGLCGLRVGYALCGGEDFVRAVDVVRQPFFCNAAAQAAAVEALRHQDAVEWRVTQTIGERLAMDEGLRAMGLNPAASQANFCFFELGPERDEEAIVQGLLDRGIVVRAGASLGAAGSLRVTYGLPEENELFRSALAELLG